MTRRSRREHDHYGETSGKSSASQFPEGSLFDQRPLADNENNQPKRAGLPREYGMQPPAQSSSPTSQASADRLRRTYESKLQRIYDYIDAQGATGATRYEISVLSKPPIPIQTVCGAVRRLYQMGEKGIERGIGSNPGHERVSAESGAPCEVLVAARFVERWKRGVQ